MNLFCDASPLYPPIHPKRCFPPTSLRCRNRGLQRADSPHSLLHLFHFVLDIVNSTIVSFQKKLYPISESDPKFPEMSDLDLEKKKKFGSTTHPAV